MFMHISREDFTLGLAISITVSHKLEPNQGANGTLLSG